MPDVVKNVAFQVRQLSTEHTAFVAATSDMAGKTRRSVALTDDLVKNGLNASTIVREAAKSIKGGGGGQPGFAQAGGKDKEGLSAALSTLTDAIK
ncbi:MAG: alanine--tRNA ligase, partial [Duncaniella sp.]|nr:alanine--tRNA ligase [Duncaniella sp.]